MAISSSAVFPMICAPTSLKPCNQAWVVQSATCMPKRYLQKSRSIKNLDEPDKLVSPVFGLVPALSALFAVPCITLKIDLLVAPFSPASGIRNIILLYLCDNPANRKVIRVIVHAQVRIFDLLDRLELVAAETSTCSVTTST